MPGCARIGADFASMAGQRPTGGHTHVEVAMKTRSTPTGRVSGTRQRLRSAAAARTSQQTSSADFPAPTREQIAARAYEIFLERGAAHGDDIQDWLAAEKELLTRLTAAAATHRREEEDTTKPDIA